jgi:hypothetical protein
VYCPPQALPHSAFLHSLLTFYTSKPISVWQRNPSSVCISSTAISAVHCALPLVFLVHAPHLFIIDNIRPKISTIFLSHLFVNFGRFCVVVFTTFHILNPYGLTHFKYLLKVFTFVTVDISVAIHD